VQNKSTTTAEAVTCQLVDHTSSTILDQAAKSIPPFGIGDHDELVLQATDTLVANSGVTLECEATGPDMVASWEQLSMFEVTP
jgi:hypothetical protein